MKTALLTATLFAFAAAPLFAQQPPPVNPSTPPAESPASPQSTGELRSKLDTKTAKTGDDIVIETSSTVKTADGTEIPKGSKLTGHVVAVKASENGATSQVAVNINEAEIKGGQTLPIHSEIQSVGSEADKSSAASAPDAMSRSAQAPAANAGAAGMPGSSGGNAAGMPSGAAAASPNASANTPGYAPGYTPGTTPTSSGPAAGSIVARNGHIAIRTTAVPGVLLANNAPGEQDPRMAQASGILLGAKKDVVLDSGTKVVLGISATPAAAGAAPRGAASK